MTLHLLNRINAMPLSTNNLFQDVIGNSVKQTNNKQYKADVVRLKQCEAEASASNCVKHSVGCIITDASGVILSSGYNGSPEGHSNCGDVFPHFKRDIERLDRALEINDNELIHGERQNLCDAHHDWSNLNEIHAEVNAIIKSDPVRRKGGTLYVNLQPCSNCAKMIAASGVGRVVFGKAYHRSDDSHNVKMFSQLNIEYIHLDGVI